MKPKYLLLLLLLPFASMAFKPVTPTLRFGTYGVCQQGGQPMEHIRLIINPDNSFQYTDHSDPKRPVATSGNWELNGTTLKLKNYTSAFKIHHVWKLQEGGLCVKSRKGLNFYRLCGCN